MTEKPHPRVFWVFKPTFPRYFVSSFTHVLRQCNLLSLFPPCHSETSTPATYSKFSHKIPVTSYLQTSRFCSGLSILTFPRLVGLSIISSDLKNHFLISFRDRFLFFPPRVCFLELSPTSSFFSSAADGSGPKALQVTAISYGGPLLEACCMSAIIYRWLPSGHF